MSIYEDKTQRDPYLIHREICIPNTLSTCKESVYQFAINSINEKLKYNISTSEITQSTCTNGTYEINTYDKIIVLLIILYTSLVFISTYFDKYKRNRFRGYPDKFLLHFSLYRSWKNRTDISKNENYQKLLSMQGLRVYMMLIVFLLHLTFIYFNIPVKNPNYHRDLLYTGEAQYWSKYLLAWGTFIVLYFFVVSSWLATVQLYKTFENSGKITLRNVVVIIVNRYFRFISAAIFISIFISNWKYVVSTPFNFDVMRYTDNSCQQDLLLNIFMMANFKYWKNICYPVTWSLSADFQMYIINVIVIYIIFKYKLNEFRVYFSMLVGFCFINGFMIYWYNAGVIFNFDARETKLFILDDSVDFAINYLSTFSTASSSCIGIILGVIYVNIKSKEFSNGNTLYSIVWFLLFLGLPIFAVVLSTREGTGFVTAIYGALVKPVYCLGLGIGVLGMALNLGGHMKKIYENKYVVFLSNFTFSGYICHWALLHFLISIHEPPTLSNGYIVTAYVILSAASIIVAIFFTIFVEEPLLSLQKAILPQIKEQENIKNEMTKKML
ncbi:uncharacterized protein LOC126883279 isoform X2 [Diabrotica virgifera virgifera]|uniref:Acyltransferase 3 domain-containing protein n=1 Tax=Diabrotica virgifera virgifera TaxID=50390 RepID=A0ABM5K309_DIAVI|nr:uncharacterized protein LOC126883279 isoform X2 [Diabrotica virgifera virgifera]